jgi:hypothetical protein
LALDDAAYSGRERRRKESAQEAFSLIGMKVLKGEEKYVFQFVGNILSASLT